MQATRRYAPKRYFIVERRYAFLLLRILRYDFTIAPPSCSYDFRRAGVVSRRRFISLLLLPPLPLFFPLLPQSFLLFMGICLKESRGTRLMYAHVEQKFRRKSTDFFFKRRKLNISTTSWQNFTLFNHDVIWDKGKKFLRRVINRILKIV